MQYHTPVLIKETINFLNPKDNGIYVDCTLGGGSHVENLKLQTSNIKIIGIDQDQDALDAAKTRLAKFENITYIKDNFKHLKKHIQEPVDGILFDLGVSSHQIDTAERGFSIQKDGPLDMRMSKGLKTTAEEIINTYDKEELQKIFKEFGEERFAHRIAKAICRKRGLEKIRTTFQLKEIVEKAIPTWKKRESVTRIFQSLRIFINDELDVLKTALKDAIDLLKPGGRIVIISYHSLEDRIAKRTFVAAKLALRLKVLTKKPIQASLEEISLNPRSRSAKLRAGEKNESLV